MASSEKPPGRQGPYADTRYGRIPLIERSLENAYGKVIYYHDYDLNFKPKMPGGAVVGDPHKQNFCPMCHVPRYFYSDEEKVCVQCGDTFVFSGKEQKYWYEGLQFNFHSIAIRCTTCRRLQRSEKALRAQLSAARSRLRQNPDDPHALLEDAEGCVRYFERTGEGNLNRGIASARKALKIWPKAIEGLYWEGLAHSLAGRPEKSRPLLETFVEKAGVIRKKKRPLFLEARKLLGD